ncbi:MAG TPA: DNA-formamidopyrimidine glycosylase family protein [Acidimicrobiales bacterium]
MPEGDTIHRTAAALRAAMLGKPMTAFQATRLSGLRPTPGAVIERVEATGKHLEIGWDDGVVLHTHMRMTGSWHLYRTGERWRKSTKQMRVVIEVPGWQAVCFAAPVVETYRAKAMSRHPGLGSLGPDLARPGVDIEACVERMARFSDADTTVGDVLLDQRVACGVGNVFKSETLWACEVSPFTLVAALPVELRFQILQQAATLLQANVERAHRETVSGSPEGLAVYGRFGKPCLRCSTPIEVRRHGEQARVTYWCPGCQPLLEPPAAVPDDPQAPPRPRRRGLFGRRHQHDAGAATDGGVRPAEPLDAADEMTPVADPDTVPTPLDERTDEPAPFQQAPIAFDRHPAAQRFLANRPNRLEPEYVDPLLARQAGA